jgi:Domain of unknown function (DUF4936)
LTLHLHLAMRELFFYWHADADAADTATRAVADWQARLRRAFPGLRALLYRRADSAGSTATLMETYAGTGGALADVLERRIVDEGNLVAHPWIRGERKLEIFVRCGE